MASPDFSDAPDATVWGVPGQRAVLPHAGRGPPGPEGAGGPGYPAEDAPAAGGTQLGEAELWESARWEETASRYCCYCSMFFDPHTGYLPENVYDVLFSPAPIQQNGLDSSSDIQKLQNHIQQLEYNLKAMASVSESTIDKITAWSGTLRSPHCHVHGRVKAFFSPKWVSFIYLLCHLVRPENGCKLRQKSSLNNKTIQSAIIDKTWKGKASYILTTAGEHKFNSNSKLQAF